ncbi:MAG: Holliday junction DNA helicase RuvA [Lentisphaeria bacterium]|jgi:Holliday junction DNA helicase RuvA
MIGRLKGVIAEKQAPHLLLDVGGVGYEVQAPMTTFYRLPKVGEAVLLHTHFAVSEISQQLFGFVHKQDRALFRLLIKVSGVGPKMAIAIMAMESEDFVRCVRDGSVTPLVKVPGVGRKTAERLIIEMRDRLNDWALVKSDVPHLNPESDSAVDNQYGELQDRIVVSLSEEEVSRRNNNAIIADAESALVSLGYKPAEAAKAISAALNPSAPPIRSEDLIRIALKSMLPA